jgi:hypothetical protein
MRFLFYTTRITVQWFFKNPAYKLEYKTTNKGAKIVCSRLAIVNQCFGSGCNWSAIRIRIWIQVDQNFPRKRTNFMFQEPERPLWGFDETYMSGLIQNLSYCILYKNFIKQIWSESRSGFSNSLDPDSVKKPDPDLLSPIPEHCC